MTAREKNMHAVVLLLMMTLGCNGQRSQELRQLFRQAFDAQRSGDHEGAVLKLLGEKPQSRAGTEEEEAEQ